MVTYSVDGRCFDRLQDAVIHAREKAKRKRRHDSAVPIFADPPFVVIGVVTDDANGLTVHRLATWPAGVECAY